MEMKQIGWWITLLVSVAAVIAAIFGLLQTNPAQNQVTLKEGVYIREAYHYYPDGIRCHCMAVAGLVVNDDGEFEGLRDEDGNPYLDVRNLRIEDSNGQTCTLVFNIGNSSTLYCQDNVPLSNLNYNVLNNPSVRSILSLIITAISMLTMILAIIKLATPGSRTHKENTNEQQLSN